VGEANVETLGEHLKRTREEQGIALEDIESVTKIGLAYLRNIEADRFDLLPAPIFTLGFLKQYAQCVGLDPQDVVLRYRLEVRKEGVPSTEGAVGNSWSLRRRAFWILLALVLGLVALWIFLAPGGNRKQERVRSIRFPRITERELKKQDLRKELDMSGAGTAEEGAFVAGGGVPASPPALEPVPASEPVALTLQAPRETHITVTLDGGMAQRHEVRAGDRISWQADRSIALEIGNGDAVRVFYRGEVYEDLGQKGEVVHIAFPPPAS